MKNPLPERLSMIEDFMYTESKEWQKKIRTEIQHLRQAHSKAMWVICTGASASRKIVIYEGLKAKFSQNSDLFKMLKDTGDVLLAECAVKDRIWGIGVSMTYPDRFDRTKWNGHNLLGYALMMVREKL